MWFSLGCAASRVDEVDISIKAWHHAVTLEPEFGEAWNNLAGAYLKKNEKHRAQCIFKEALRCSHDNVKIWENFLVVSTDLFMWEDCLRAYHRLLELQPKFLDVDILATLVHAITRGFPDKDIQPASQLRGSLGQLLGRITAQGKVPAAVWKCYANYHLTSSLRSDHAKGVQELQKAQRAARLQPSWDRHLESVMEVIELTLAYSRACRQVYASDEACKREDKEALASLSSAKLALQAALSKAKDFGITSRAELEGFISQLQAEIKLLLQCIG